MKPRVFLLHVVLLRLSLERRLSLRGIKDGVLRFCRQYISPFSEKEQLRFAERTSFLLRAGIPLLECLEVISAQEQRPRARTLYAGLVRDVSSGSPLSAALKGSGERIDPFFIACAQVGEQSGSLSENLRRVAEELREKDVVKKKIISALIYPAFIIGASVGIIGLITAYIFPKILPIFQSLDITLPVATRAVLFMSGVLARYGFFMLAGLWLMVIAFMIIRKCSERFRTLMTVLMLRAPILGNFVRAHRMSVFARMQAMLLRSGLSITQSIKVSGETFADPLYQRECRRLYERLAEGSDLAACMRVSPFIFPSFAADMVGIGERSGSLSEMFSMLAEHFAGEVEEKIRIFTSLVEPALMIIMGVIVGFIAVSVITPLYRITEHLNG